MILFETERLAVRPWTAADAAAAFAVYRDAEVTRFLSTTRTHETLDDSHAWLQQMAEYNAARPAGMGRWAATLRATGEPIGSLGIAPLDGGPEIEIGYHIGRAWWGQGYATELARGGRDYAFDTLGLSRLVGVTFSDNLASQRVLTKIGLRHQGRGRYFGYELEYFALDAAERDGQGRA